MVSSFRQSLNWNRGSNRAESGESTLRRGRCYGDGRLSGLEGRDRGVGEKGENFAFRQTRHNKGGVGVPWVATWVRVGFGVGRARPRPRGRGRKRQEKISMQREQWEHSEVSLSGAPLE